jgi:hypothetical protein
MPAEPLAEPAAFQELASFNIRTLIIAIHEGWAADTVFWDGLTFEDSADDALADL